MTEKGPRASGAREAGASLGQPRITDRRLLESLGSMNSSGISSVLWHNPCDRSAVVSARGARMTVQPDESGFRRRVLG